MKKYTLTVLLLIFALISQAQIKDAIGLEREFINYYDKMKTYNLSSLWTSGSLIKAEFEEEDAGEIFRPEPIGYIGDDFQRFHIHFISIIQNWNNKTEYFISGKTKVKENICNFNGVLNVRAIRLFQPSDSKKYRQGIITGDYIFFEDSMQKGSGMFKGVFTSYFILDKQGKLHYDALSLIADGYKNNQFEGTWKSYATGKEKKCNWGDYRIPDSRSFDVGTAEFNPDPVYYDKGWENYQHLFESTSLGEEARKKEEQTWWKK